MGFGYGPGSEMMKDYKNNLRRKPKDKSKSITGKKKASVKSKEISKAELEEFKLKFIEKQQRDTIRNIIVFSIIGLALLFIFGFILFG